MDIQKRFVIFSTSLMGIEYQLTPQERQTLNVYGMLELQGSYKGTVENSYAVIASEDSALEYVIGLANKYGQESLLIVDEYKQATLRYKDSKIEKLGYFTEVNALEVQDLDNWTFCPKTLQYFTTK